MDTPDCDFCATSDDVADLEEERDRLKGEITELEAEIDALKERVRDLERRNLNARRELEHG